MSITFDQLDDPANDFVTAYEVAQLCDVKPATVRVWAHRGKLSTVGYAEFEGGAVYSQAEALSLANDRGITVNFAGMSLHAVSYELGITRGEVLVLVHAGELHIVGRSFAGEVLDEAEVRQFAVARGITLRSNKLGIQRRQLFEARRGRTVAEAVRKASGLVGVQRQRDEDAAWEERERVDRMNRIDRMLEDMQLPDH